LAQAAPSCGFWLRNCHGVVLMCFKDTLFFIALVVVVFSLVFVDSMPHVHSAASRVVRRARAHDRGYIAQKVFVDSTFVEVPTALGSRVRDLAASLCLHSAHDEIAGTRSHFARTATLAAAPFLTPDETSRALMVHRSANIAKHSWRPSAVKWSDLESCSPSSTSSVAAPCCDVPVDLVFVEDPWAKFIADHGGRPMLLLDAGSASSLVGGTVASAAWASWRPSTFAAASCDEVQSSQVLSADACTQTDDSFPAPCCAVLRQVDEGKMELTIRELKTSLRKESLAAPSRRHADLEKRVDTLTTNLDNLQTRLENLLANNLAAALGTVEQMLALNSASFLDPLNALAGVVGGVSKNHAEMDSKLHLSHEAVGVLSGDISSFQLQLEHVESRLSLLGSSYSALELTMSQITQATAASVKINEVSPMMYIDIGMRVLMHGLVKKPQLNGKLGIVKSLDLNAGRAGVVLDGTTDPVAVKIASLFAVGSGPPPPSSTASSSSPTRCSASARACSELPPSPVCVRSRSPNIVT